MHTLAKRPLVTLGVIAAGPLLVAIMACKGGPGSTAAPQYPVHSAPSSAHTTYSAPSGTKTHPAYTTHPVHTTAPASSPASSPSTCGNEIPCFPSVTTKPPTTTAPPVASSSVHTSSGEATTAPASESAPVDSAPASPSTPDSPSGGIDTATDTASASSASSALGSLPNTGPSEAPMLVKVAAAALGAGALFLAIAWAILRRHGRHS